MKKEATYRKLKLGDISSFKLVYNEFHSQIYFYSLKLVQQETIAEEITGDVFLTLWNKRAIIDPSLPIQHFLYKIAKDISYNYIKKLKRDASLYQAYINNHTFAHEIIELKNGETQYLEKEHLMLVNEVIESLSPKRLEIFKLRYFENQDNKKISQKLGISINTVKAHLVQARTFLKEKILKKKEIYWVFFLFNLISI